MKKNFQEIVRSMSAKEIILSMCVKPSERVTEIQIHIENQKRHYNSSINYRVWKQ